MDFLVQNMTKRENMIIDKDLNQLTTILMLNYQKILLSKEIKNNIDTLKEESNFLFDKFKSVTTNSLDAILYNAVYI